MSIDFKMKFNSYPLENKPWKEKLHHQESALDKKLRDETSMEEENEREGGMEIEGEGEKLNFEVSLTSFSFIKVTTRVNTCFYL